MVGCWMEEISLLNQNTQSHMVIILIWSLKMTRNRSSFLGGAHDIDVLKFPLYPSISDAEETTLIWESKICTQSEVMQKILI